MFLVRIHLLPFGKVWLGSVCWPPCATRGNEAERRINGGWVSSGSILSRLWTKFMKFWDNVQDILSYFPMSLPDCLCRVSVRRYSPSSLEVVEKRKPNKCKTILAMIFLGGTTLTFLRRIVSAIYCPPFDKVWLSSVCWSPSAKPGNEV